jgi:hypothetical protein
VARVDEYVSLLRSLDQVEPYLLAESGLPGPRGNIELAEAAARVVDEETLQRWASLDEQAAPENTPQVLLVFTGLLGLGRLVAAGRDDVLPRLRAAASDPRWRVREGVATALQHLGDADFEALCSEMDGWLEGTWLEQRAAAAAVCEPRLLNSEEDVGRVLAILDRITTAVAAAEKRAGDDFRALRQALGYCWSVAVAARPEQGEPVMERWLRSDNRDVRWIMRENLRKRRLSRADPAWVERWMSELGRP